MVQMKMRGRSIKYSNLEESMKHLTTSALTNIAMGVGALIVGGLAIFSISRIIPFPGGKYLLMAPYLSMVIYVIMHRVPRSITPFLVGGVFGGIMGFVNLFMGLSIVLTGIGAALSSVPFKDEKHKIFIGATAFSTFTLLTSLNISKYMIGGVFETIPNWWIYAATLIGTGFGAFGALIGRHILKYLKTM